MRKSGLDVLNLNPPYNGNNKSTREEAETRAIQNVKRLFQSQKDGDITQTWSVISVDWSVFSKLIYVIESKP